MSSPWALILLYLTVPFSVTGHKLPLSDQPPLTGPHNKEEYGSSPLVWEWKTQDNSDKTLLTLIRMVREVPDKKTTGSQPDVKYPSKAEKISPPPKSLSLEFSPEVSMHTVSPSKDSYTEPQTKEPFSKDETTAISELDRTSPKDEKLSEAETTETDKSVTAAKKTIATEIKFTKMKEQPSTPSPAKFKDLSVFTKSTANEATTFAEIHSTNTELLSTIADSTTNTVVEETTSNVPAKIPKDTPSKPVVTSAEPTTQDKTTGWSPDSKGSSTIPAPITYISTTSEDKILAQSIIKQCMLTILILAVVCTIFIITTIALAAKLSTMRQKHKLRHPATYTEMRCISSLLPESDQQNKGKPKRLKTFTPMEESDGDNTTLNSFLPDH
uniref:P-selectin glycoprotein ligand 1 n=2 Tax=Pyxicephalus adspersus TaxID=30357 RepID=A0AAV2ZWC5_PYXAD|nr:TPA: hypothetical protein GDO54_013841 [Pyxicephalus adspersus]